MDPSPCTSTALQRQVVPEPGGCPGDWRVPGGSDKAGADNIPVALCVEPMVSLECCCQTGGSVDMPITTGGGKAGKGKSELEGLDSMESISNDSITTRAFQVWQSCLEKVSRAP